MNRPVQSNVIRLAALFEATKGLVVLLVATGLTSLIHRDVYAIAAWFVEHIHLNPATRYPRIFLDAANHLGDSHLVILAIGAAIYSVVRLIEAYGLYLEYAWAEVLAAGSGATYVPFEVAGLVSGVTWYVVFLLLLNTAVVAIMVRALFTRRLSRLQHTP